MKKQWMHPFWENSNKDRITVRLNITHDDGTYTSTVARVSKYDENGNITRDYQEVLEQNSIEQINAFTEDRLEKHKARREGEIRKQEEEKQSRMLEELFNAKLKAFEIPEIKNSPNRELKKKLRRSKNNVELNAYATMIIMEAHKNENKE